MADSSAAIHVGARAALVASSAVTDITTRIYDAVPAETGFPFVQMTIEIGEPYDGVGLDGWEAILRLDLFNRNAGQVAGDLYDLAAACKAALHNQDFTVTGHTLVNSRMLPSGNRVVRDPDQVTTQIVQRYRIVTQA